MADPVTDPDVAREQGADAAPSADGRSDDGPADGASSDGPRWTPPSIRPGGPSVTIERSSRSLLLQARLGLAVGVLGLLAAAFVLVTTSDVRSEQAAREDALIAGELAVLRVSTWSGTDMATFVADLASMSTDAYAPEIERTFTPELQASLASFQVESVGQVLNSYVQEVDGDTAQVYVRVGQTFTVPGRPVPVEDRLDYEVTLQRVDGEWLIDSLFALGPTQFELMTPDGETADPAAPAPDQPPAPTAAPEEGSAQ